jgi:hypothetical protein
MTETTVPPRHATTIESYVRFWNAEFAGDQDRLARATFADDVVYEAPLAVLQTPDSLIGFRNEFAEQLGAVEFHLRAEPDVVGNRARLCWEIRVGSGFSTSFAEGTDVLTFDDQGRVATVTTFIDRAPVGFEPGGHEHAGRREGRW